MDRQQAKERACSLAYTRGFSLFQRGHQIFAVRPDGHVVLVCGSKSTAVLWVKAYQILLHDTTFAPKTEAMYRIITPYGLYEASSWYLLLWKWFRGRIS